MTTHPRATVPARQQQPELISAKELERIRCAFRSGLTEPTVGVLLDQIAIRDTAIHTFARQAAASGTPAQQAAAQMAEESIDPEAPVHIRIEFEVTKDRFVGADSLIETIREWTLDAIAGLVDTARVTATYRGESEKWETERP